MERKLELKDIAGYISDEPYQSKKHLIGYYIGHICKITPYILFKDGVELAGYKPVLYPIDTLCRTVTHNGKEIVPIVELAKIAFKNNQNWWFLSIQGNGAFHDFYGLFYFENGSFLISDNEFDVKNQYQLFDYLHELKIDYRGLIDAGLAVDVNTLNVNPYK